MITSEMSYMYRLIDEGMSIAAVARLLGRSRQTLYNWLKRGREPAVRARRASKLDPFKPYLESRLERFDLPATVLLKEIRERGYTGGMTILREFVAAIKERQVRRLVDRFETEPGRQTQMDWASCGTIVHNGRRRRLSLFVLVLGYSRTIWASFAVSERRPVVLELLEQGFRELGGVSRELLVDNFKQAVEVARTPEKPAKLQKEFASFADHWGFEVIASPPYWPRAKGKVERAIQYLKQSFLEGREFEDLDQLNAQLRQWLAEVANVRIHGTTRERPIDRLGADQAVMLPLVNRPFPAAERYQRRADHDARISYAGVRYSVDPEILKGRRGVPVEVCVGTDGRLRIYNQDHLVGEHQIVPAGSPPQDDPCHAEARRRLAQRPTWKRPQGRTPRFDQAVHEIDVELLLASAPAVEDRPLAAYEGSA